MERLSILLDVGGVMVDQRRRARQWPQLVGDAFVVLLGGNRQAWIEAHRISTRQLDSTYAQASASGDFLTFLRGYHLAWVRTMCTLLDLPLPPVEECLALAARAIALASGRVQAALPGAAEVVRILHHQGYPLYTASGACSLEITGYLQGMGVQSCFGRAYGADLINAFKDGPNYYARLFSDLGISPAHALVVDDSADAIAWAAQTGAGTALVEGSSDAKTAATARIGSLADLPTLLEQRHGDPPTRRCE